MRITRETWLLLVMGLADLASTVLLIRAGIVHEANPLMAWYLVHFGVWAFCAVKCTMLFCPLLILEWARRIKPHVGRWALRAAVIGYLFLYLGAVWRTNHAYITNVLRPYAFKVQQTLRRQSSPSVPARRSHPPMVMPVATELRL